MSPTLAELQDEFIEEVAECTYDPLAYVDRFFPWETSQVSDSTGPRKWQREMLRTIGEHFADPKTRFTPLRVAVASGHGIGKSALVSMITGWGMSTFEDTKVLITAGTGTQLATKTGPELSKWFHLAYNNFWFDVHKTSIRARDPRHEDLWRADLVTWSIENTDAFQGLHNKGRRIILIFDEASAIHDLIWETAEGALTDENTEILWLAFGNPIRNTGRFRECFGRFKHRWQTFQIDSRNVEGTNKEQIAQWVNDWGEDSDFVRVRVRGEFPRAGSNQFIASDLVERARHFKTEPSPSLPRILSVDVARFGDDQTVLGLRQGRKFGILEKLRGRDTVFVAERALYWREKENADAVVIDGDGLGAGVIDHIHHRGYRDRIFEFHGGGVPVDVKAYFNKRAECWGLMRDWLANASIPDDPELAADLCAPEYGFSPKGQVQLEKKDDMKLRGLASPDCGDCLAQTFAVKLAPVSRPQRPTKNGGTWT